MSVENEIANQYRTDSLYDNAALAVRITVHARCGEAHRVFTDTRYYDTVSCCSWLQRGPAPYAGYGISPRLRNARSLACLARLNASLSTLLLPMVSFAASWMPEDCSC